MAFRLSPLLLKPIYVMKRTTATIIFLFILIFTIYAQRVNEYGLKMVSEVEVFDYELDKIILKYNEQNRLIGMTVYKDWNWNMAKYDAQTYVPKYKLYAEYNIKNGKMICKRYDEEYRNPLYDFKFDEWGHIVSFKEKYLEAWHNGYVAVQEYGYSYDERMKRYVSTEGWFGKFKYIRNGERLDFNVKNDTNISIWWILTFPNCESSVDYYFQISEWVDCINDYMLKPDWDRGSGGCYNDQQYEYEYDSKGNLIEVRRYEQYNTSLIEVIDGIRHEYPYRVNNTIKLKYVD